MKRREAKEIRRILDGVIAAIGAADEEGFNGSAAAINENAAAIRVWLPGTAEKPREYARGEMRIDPADGIPYRAMHDHVSYEGAELQPHRTPSIWTHCHGTSAETAREFVSEGHNPYMEGHWCVENGVKARCRINNTVFGPGVQPEAWETERAEA